MAINREAMKALPIQGYLDYAGIEYTQKHNYLNLVEHDSLVINLKKNRFIWNSRGVSGDLGDFISAYEDIPMKEAFQKWTAYSRFVEGADENIVEKYKNQVPKIKEFSMDRWKTSKEVNNSMAYLTQQRGLHPQFLQGMVDAGLIKQGISVRDKETKEFRKPPVLFPWTNENGKVVGLDQQGTDVNFEKFGKRGTEKRIAPGSANEEYGYNFKFGNGADHLIIFEAPIDALSYAQQNFRELRQQNATLMSLSGTNHTKVLHEIRRMNEQNGRSPRQLTIATDNDIAGYGVASRLNQLAFENIETIREIPINGKDWNDQLRSGQRGSTKMTFDESDQRLKQLESMAETKQVRESSPEKNKVTERPVTDGRAVKGKPLNARPVANSRNTLQSPTTVQTRSERRKKNELANQAIIEGALKEVKAWHKDPKVVTGHLDFLANGPAFSPRNAMLISAQRPNSSIVMGYDQFQNHGIQVNKGEQGIKVIGAPTMQRKIMTASEGPVFWRDASPEQREAAKQGKLPTEETMYYPTETVFDVTQTNATKEQIMQLLPEKPINLSVDNSPEHLNNAYKELTHYVNESGFKVQDEQTNSFLEKRQAHYKLPEMEKSVILVDKKNPDNNYVLLQENMPLKEKVATLGHEVGRLQMHLQSTNVQQSEEIKAAKADMSSYVVLRNLGLSKDEIESNYVPTLGKSLEHLKTANVDMQKTMAEVTQASSSVTGKLSENLINGNERSFSIQQLDNKKGRSQALLAEQSSEQTRTQSADRGR